MSQSPARQSLQALQERLASRLATAQVSGADATWLAVEVRGQRCLLPLVQSGEIFPVPVIQRVPYTQPWFLGVAALRGGLMGVVDLGALLAPQAPTEAMPTAALEAKLVALHPALGVNAALWVDRLLGLRGVGAFTAAQARDPDALPVLGQTLTDAAGQSWQEVNLQALAEWPTFLSVAA
jgi:twitching motility protein PilI